MAMTLTCASDAYKFNLAAHVVDQGGNVAGTWSEVEPQYLRLPAGPRRRRQFPGSCLDGGLQRQHLAAHRGNKQSVSMRADSQFRGADISLSK